MICPLATSIALAILSQRTILCFKAIALVALLAAKQISVEGCISIAGAGESIDKIILWQLGPGSEERTRYIKGVIAKIRESKNPIIEDTTLKSVFPQNLNAYWKSWMKYNPAELISELKNSNTHSSRR